MRGLVPAEGTAERGDRELNAWLRPRRGGCSKRAAWWHRQGPFDAHVVDGVRHHARPDGSALLCGRPVPVKATAS